MAGKDVFMDTWEDSSRGQQEDAIAKGLLAKALQHEDRLPSAAGRATMGRVDAGHVVLSAIIVVLAAALVRKRLPEML